MARQIQLLVFGGFDAEVTELQDLHSSWHSTLLHLRTMTMARLPFLTPGLCIGSMPRSQWSGLPPISLTCPLSVQTDRDKIYPLVSIRCLTQLTGRTKQGLTHHRHAAEAAVLVTVHALFCSIFQSHPRPNIV